MSDAATSDTLDIHRLLEIMVKQKASDLHLTVLAPPAFRINGEVHTLRRAEPLKADDIQRLAYSVMTEKQKRTFEEQSEIDLSFEWKGAARFRANFFRQQGAVAAALRQIPQDVHTMEQLGLPRSVRAMVDRVRGLILVTGPTGSGKSTTLSSMIDAINANARGHIITIEDPIEFVHQHKRCIVNQREVGSDTRSFRDALRYVLRQDPDVVLIGEIRDLETMEAALRISETGHLVLATLHTNNTIQTIHRVLDFYPARQQDMVRTQLSFVLEGVLSQQLIPRADGAGRVMAIEVMVPNPAIRNLIREDKTHQIYSQMQIGKAHHGMQTLNESLTQLVTSRAITVEQALNHSYDPEELEAMLRGDGRPGQPVTRR
ncbi:MAG: twitching motility protein PilT [Myxococcales bacterium]